MLFLSANYKTQCHKLNKTITKSLPLKMIGKLMKHNMGTLCQAKLKRIYSFCNVIENTFNFKLVYALRNVS